NFWSSISRARITASAASMAAPPCAGWSNASCPRWSCSTSACRVRTVSRWLREKSGRIGIIMVTAATDTVDRVVGLETGADDYIPKPVELRELLARVKSVLRRSTGNAVITVAPRIRMGRLVLDLDKRVLVEPDS